MNMNKEQIHIHFIRSKRSGNSGAEHFRSGYISWKLNITDEKISVQITPTYSGCPAMEIIQEEIRTALAKHGLRNVEIKQVTVAGMDN